MFYWGILLQRTGSIFKAMIQRTDGCTEVLLLLVQSHHIIRCSHKRYKIAISTSTWYLDTVKKAQASLCKRADSQEPLLPAQEILICITLPSDFAWANVQTH